METPIANELQFLENFNELKSQLKNHLKLLPAYLNEGKMDSDYSIEEIRNLVVHGFESSEIISTLERFIANNSIVQSHDTKLLLERFSSNYPYLEQYNGSALQATTIIDYILSLSFNSDRCLNLLNLLPKLCDKFEMMDTHQNQIGYYNCMRQIITALSLYNTNRNQSFGIEDFLATQCYTFNTSNMTQKLKQEDIFNNLKQIDLSTLATLPGLKETITKFDIFSRKDENLLNYVFSYSIYMNRLMDFKNLVKKESNCLSLEEILKTDLFSLIGEIIFDNKAKVSLNDIEAIVCNLNTNLLHVITKNTCPAILVCDKFHANRDAELNDILNLLTGSEVSEEHQNNDIDKENLFKIQNRDILNYVQQHNELVAYLLAKIHNIELDDDQTKTLNCEFLNNLMQMKEINIRTKSQNENNKMIAALRFDYFDLATIKELILRKDYW